MCVGFHGHNTINSQLAEVNMRRARMDIGSDSCHSGRSPNSTWRLGAGRGDMNIGAYWSCFLTRLSPTSPPQSHTITYVSLVICIVSQALDSWGTIMNSHVAGGTLPWQFTSPDCKIFWPFLLLKMAGACLRFSLIFSICEILFLSCYSSDT